MYNALLVSHNLLRWVVLILILVTIFKGFSGWSGSKTYTKGDDKLRLFSVLSVHIQLIIGIVLYFISPITKMFMNNFSDAVKDSSIRFFGMEHSIMMIIAVVLITIGSAKAKRKIEDKKKFRTLAIWFTIALLIMLASIPWEFSPMASRPNFRGF